MKKRKRYTKVYYESQTRKDFKDLRDTLKHPGKILENQDEECFRKTLYVEDLNSMYYYHGKNILRLIGKGILHYNYQFSYETCQEKYIQDYVQRLEPFVEAGKRIKKQAYLDEKEIKRSDKASRKKEKKQR